MPNPDGQITDARSILKQTGVDVQAGEFVIISVSREGWSRMLQDNSLSPSGEHPFMIFSEANEVTLVVDSSDFERMGEARFPRRAGFRMLTFTAEMDFSVTGFLAEVTAILAAANIPLFAISSFSRDHLLVKQTELANALSALGPHVESLC